MEEVEKVTAFIVKVENHRRAANFQEIGKIGGWKKFGRVVGTTVASHPSCPELRASSCPIAAQERLQAVLAKGRAKKLQGIHGVMGSALDFIEHTI